MHDLGHMLATYFTNLTHGGVAALTTVQSALASRRPYRPHTDLSDRVAPPFFPFVEAGVLAPWFTGDHKLVLSEKLRVKTALSFEAAAHDGPLSTLAMVGSCNRSQRGHTVLSVSIRDVGGSTLARAPLRAEPLAGSHLLVGSFQPIETNPHDPLFVSVHRDGVAGADWCVYQWRRSGLTRKSDHHALFGVLL